jgi:alcohol dehydrogenase
MVTESWVVEAPGKMVLRQFPVPAVPEDGMLVRVEMVGICGSDPTMFKGHIPTTPLPLILGHEMAGRVEKVGAEASRVYGVKEGDRLTVEPYRICGRCIYCLQGRYQMCKTRSCYGVTIGCAEPPHLFGAYGEFLYVAPGSKIHKLRPEEPAEHGMLSSVIGNGVRWIRSRAQVQMYESVVIIGPGAQGLAAVIAAKESGANPIIVIGLARDEKRLALALEYGADRTLRVDVEDPAKAIRDLIGPQGADVVVETSGSTPGRNFALEVVRPVGRVVIVGVKGGPDPNLMVDTLIFKELQVLGGLGQAWDVEPAMRIIQSGKYDLGKMVTHRFPMSKADEALHFFMEHPEECLRVALIP